MENLRPELRLLQNGEQALPVAAKVFKHLLCLNASALGEDIESVANKTRMIDLPPNWLRGQKRRIGFYEQAVERH